MCWAGSGVGTEAFPELSPYLPLASSAVSCLYTVTRDCRYQMRHLKMVPAENSGQ